MDRYTRFSFIFYIRDVVAYKSRDVHQLSTAWNHKSVFGWQSGCGNLYSSLIVNSHSDPWHFPHLPYSLRCRVSFFHVLHYSSIYVKLQLCSDRNLSRSISRTFLSYTDQDKRLKFQYVLLKSIWVFFSILNLKIHLIQLIKWQEKTLKSKKKRFQQGLNSQPTDDQSTIITNTLKSQLLERHTEKPWSSLQSCLTDSS